MTATLPFLFASLLAQAAAAVPDTLASPSSALPPELAQPDQPQGAVRAAPSPSPSNPAAPPYDVPASAYPPTPYSQFYPPAAAGPLPQANASYEAATATSTPVPATPLIGLIVGGAYIPGLNLSGVAGGVTAIPFSRNGFETRFMLTGYRVKDNNSHSTGVLTVAQEIKWWDYFGLGAGAGTGYTVYHSNYSDKDTGSAQLVAFLAPATFRFGADPWVEIGLVAGLTQSFSDAPSPLGYVYAGVLF